MSQAVVRLRDMPIANRPRERLLRLGASRVTDRELLATLLGSGTRGLDAVRLAQRILDQAGGIGGLAKLDSTELSQLRGVGPGRAARILAALELGRRAMQRSASVPPTVQTAAQVHAYLAPRLAGLPQETFWLLILSARLSILREHQVALGGIDSVVIHPREVFRPALRAGGASLILVHNHPSGDPTPSDEDVSMTERLCRAGTLLGVPVLDHVVIAGNRYASLAEEGLISGTPRLRAPGAGCRI